MRKTLTCPWCGAVMEPGDLESQRFINWVPRNQDDLNLRELLSWEGIKELCAPLTGNIRIPVGEDWKNAFGQIPAYHCPKCKVFLFQGMVKEDKE